MVNQNSSDQSSTNPDILSDSPEETIKKVCQKLEQWKTHLLDLTRKNRLLYFTPTSRTTVPIISPSAQEIFTRIVKNQRPLRFPVLQEDQPILPGLSEEKESKTHHLPATSTRARRTADLQTALEPRELERNLYRLRREWRMWQEEQGIHILFLAIGMLRWKESPHEEEECLAPLILVPVALQREGSGKPYFLEFVEEDIVVNPVLSFKLDRDYGIHLPELPEEIDELEIDKYIKHVEETVLSQGWSVNTELWLGKFSFQKFVMYKDLEDHREEATNHPIIAALADPSSLPPPPDIPGLDNLDEIVNVQEVFPVLDADSSQVEVLVRARQGQNIVVQGPPGTGKSQTIANLIAQALRDNKKVLFVSEKMAALEVVYRRIEELGLAFACLEVHSHKSDKAKVIAELGRTLQQPMKYADSLAGMELFNNLISRRDFLNQYVCELHKPRGAQGLTAYNVHGKIAQLATVPNLEFEIPRSSFLDVSFDELDELQSAIRRLAQIPEVVDVYERHPWFGARVVLKSFSLQQRDRLLNAVESLTDTIGSIEKVVEPLAEQFGLSPPKTLNEASDFAKLVNILCECQPVPSSWYRLDSKKIQAFLHDIALAETHSRALSNARSEFNKSFQKKLLEQPLKELFQRFSDSYKSVFRWFKTSYWRETRYLQSFWIGSRRMTYRAILDGLKAAVTIQREELWFKEQEPELREALQFLYRGQRSDWNSIKIGLEWLDRLRKWFLRKPIPEHLTQLMSERDRLIKIVKRADVELEDILEKEATPVSLLEGVFKNQKIQGFTLQNVPFSMLRPWLQAKERPKDLDDWVEFLKACSYCEEKDLGVFIKTALGSGVRACQLEGIFMKKFWKGWLDEVYPDAPALAEFRATRHEDIIREFQRLDEELKGTTVTIIQNEIAKKQPKRSAALAHDSQVGILLREIQKRRRHKPLRRLFAEIRDLLQALKPCLLMSPLSVASYLQKGVFHFDLVIFDEASQIPPQDAIGTILRGNQLIVAGDNKQLPPTRFFQVDIDWSEDEEVFDEAPLDSILDECAALSGFVERSLLWHYRSRHEELIAFSNRNFYENTLITFPSPYVMGFSGAVRFVHVSDGVYDRGGSKTNRREAQRVIDLVIEHLRKYGSRLSLGVITLSIAQEEAVLNEWERRKLKEPDLDVLADEAAVEPLFIKALEKVQGDERDYIIISIGYGPDQNGKVHLQFGPIGQAGGERRLNVGITRARYQTTVVTSMLPHQLDLARLTTERRGLYMLQRYLEYAQQGGKFRDDIISTGEPENEFEVAVKTALENRGLLVDAQVGFSGFRIDLALRHPDHENRYVLGIECDGATYHSSRTARDRDCLRQEVLEGLGWVIHRIWSTDWIKDPETATNTVVGKIQKLRAKSFVGPPAPKVRRGKQQTADTGNSARNLSSSNSISTRERKAECTEANNQIEGLPGSRDILSLPVYKPYVCVEEKPLESLYSAMSTLEGLEELAKEVETIVDQEYPIHVMTVIERVASICGIDRIEAGTLAHRAIEKAINYAITKGALERRGDFLWKSGAKKLLPRRPRPGDPPRPISRVADEELLAAVYWVLKAEFGLPHDSLIRATARIIGCSRVGSHVQSRIKRLIDWLLAKGLVEANGDVLVLSHKKTLGSRSDDWLPAI